MEGADYSFFSKFDRRNPETGEVGTDNALLLADLRFSPSTEPGLELVDIVAASVRRALMGNLGEAGWRDIPRLMIHRKEPYIKLVVWGEGNDQVHQPAYSDVVRNQFSRGGKLMIAPRFMPRTQ